MSDTSYSFHKVTRSSWHLEQSWLLSGLLGKTLFAGRYCLHTLFSVGELLPMVAADQLEGMSVGIAEVETLVVFSPVDTAFNGNTVRGEVHLPLAHLCCLDGESDMHGPGAIVRRKDASRHCCWLQ